ncbi:hypothetical protein NUW54_g4816 [Trametes sanguinea]|uniref:Uncharacterized protein n=1 Tax=Trametes sanguinea TaxID=158606 RepID=A0ACC1PX06_9APHY|nr:hypothetical protein NUW54_g4816 [Trametes sanguinea]
MQLCHPPRRHSFNRSIAVCTAASSRPYSGKVRGCLFHQLLVVDPDVPAGSQHSLYAGPPRFRTWLRYLFPRLKINTLQPINAVPIYLPTWVIDAEFEATAWIRDLKGQDAHYSKVWQFQGREARYLTRHPCRPMFIYLPSNPLCQIPGYLAQYKVSTSADGDMTFSSFIEAHRSKGRSVIEANSATKSFFQRSGTPGLVVVSGMQPLPSSGQYVPFWQSDGSAVKFAKPNGNSSRRHWRGWQVPLTDAEQKVVSSQSLRNLWLAESRRSLSVEQTTPREVSPEYTSTERRMTGTTSKKAEPLQDIVSPVVRVRKLACTAAQVASTLQCRYERMIRTWSAAGSCDECVC